MSWLATDGSVIPPLLVALSFVWLGLAIGRRALIWLGASRPGTLAERGIVAMGLGAGAMQYVPFALGEAGALSTRSLRLAVGLVAVASAWDLWAVAAAAWRRLRLGNRMRPWTIAWVFALSPALLIAFLMAVTPTIDPDGLGYHLTVPKRWLESGSLDYLPTYPYSNAPMGVEMLYALAMSMAGDTAAKCIHFSLGALGLIGLYLTGKRLAGPMTGAVAATLFLVGPAGVAGLLGVAYVEGAAAFAMIGAALAWLLWFQSDERGYLRAASLLAGLAVSFKITSALLPVALLALTCVARMDPKRSGSEPGKGVGGALAFAARFVPLMLAPILPWMTRSAVVTGNPLFPLFARWIPSRDMSPDLSTKFDRFNRYMTWGNAFGRSWSIEQRSHVLFAVAASVALVGVFAIMRLRTWMSRGAAVVVVVTLLVQISAAGLYLRYSTPLASILMLPIAAALGAMLSRPPVPAVWLAATLAASCLQARRAMATLGLNVKDLVETAAGLEDRRVFLGDHLLLYPLYERINRDLPLDAKVMLSTYCPGFYIDRTTFCAEMVQDSLRFTTNDAFTSDLRRLGITHVLAPRALATGGPSPPFDGSNTSSITREGQYRAVRSLLSAHATLVATADNVGLYEVDPAFLKAR